jgi:AcrR family transcriptional regulator
MPRTKEQYEQIRTEKRQLITEAALQLFASEGYAATSIDKIARQAGISKGLMYHYFDSKEALLQNIIDSLSDEIGEMIDPNNDGVVTREEAEHFIDKMFDLLINRKEEMKLYYQCSLQPQVVDFLQHRYNSEKTLERQQLIVRYFSGKLDMNEPLAAYFTIISFLKGIFLVYTYADSFFPEDFLMKYKEEVKRMLFKT